MEEAKQLFADRCRAGVTSWIDPMQLCETRVWTVLDQPFSLSCSAALSPPSGQSQSAPLMLAMYLCYPILACPTHEMSFPGLHRIMEEAQSDAWTIKMLWVGSATP